MSPAENRMKDTGGPGIVPFELTGGQDRADEILSEWGEDGRDAARESLWIDFAFLLAYGTFLTLALAAMRDRARERGWRRLATIFASCKFALLAVTIVYLLAGLVTWVLSRGRAPRTS
jgi:hypothetical protein